MLKFISKNKKGFSLIELSIVLIIIGLLVAGVSSGTSLVESAKVRSLLNDMRNYQQAFYSFRVVKDRLPGDIDGSGLIGGGGGQEYNNNSFGGKYVSSNYAYGVPQDQVGPFVDLYLEKIIDFEPKKNTPASGKLTRENGGSPKSKAFPQVLYKFWRGWKSNETTHVMYDTPVYNYFVASGDNIKVKFFKSIDEKMDDGIYNKGKVRVFCISNSGNSGKTNYNDAKYCNEIFLIIE